MNHKTRRKVSKRAAWLLPYRWRNISARPNSRFPSAGNAGGALAAYAARAGLEAHIFMPRDTPRANIIECRELGAQVILIDGLITDCGAEIAKRKTSGRLVRHVHA